MTVKKKQEIELVVEQVAFGGKGIARVDGFTVFVDQAVTGDKVLARVYKKKKNYAEARVLELLQPSPDRVPAPCDYSGYCGGCKWQFLSYEKQILYKRQHVMESLAHIGMVRNVPVLPTMPSDTIFGYRNKMEFSCAARRWLMPNQLHNEQIDRSLAVGLHVPGTFDKVLDIDQCLLQQELGNTLLADVREFIRASAIPVYGLKTHEGFWRFIVLRHSAANDHWMINIVTSTEERHQVQPLADQLMETYPNVVSVINNITSRKAGVAVGEYEILLGGQPVITDRIGAYQFEISANSFFQTNTRQAETLYNVVRDYAGLTGTQKVLDLYCGAGTIAIYLASLAKEIVGFEVVQSAVADANRNCRRNGIGNCRFICGDLRTSLDQVDFRPDVIILDPPRSGMHQDVVEKVLAMKAKRIVYVSCNPATMARDIIPLKDVYKIETVQPVDMFPHTYHIESVARLVLAE